MPYRNTADGIMRVRNDDVGDPNIVTSWYEIVDPPGAVWGADSGDNTPFLEGVHVQAAVFDAFVVGQPKFGWIGRFSSTSGAGTPAETAINALEGAP